VAQRFQGLSCGLILLAAKAILRSPVPGNPSPGPQAIAFQCRESLALRPNRYAPRPRLPFVVHSISTACTRLPPLSAWSNIEIHTELQRMGTHSERLDFLLALIVDPAFDQLRREDVAFKQKGVISFQSIQGFIQ
jgi:hypothetical protein